MKSVVGVYTSYEAAVAAANDLKGAGYPVSQVSVVSKADLVDDHLHIKTNDTVEKAELSIGAAAGTTLGILMGVGVFAIPGLGFLFGAGALIGAIAGLEFGIIGGGLVAILTTLGVDAAAATLYEKHLNEGKYLLFASGSDEEIKHAQTVLHTNGLHVEMNSI
jgi:hypothetical protein